VPDPARSIVLQVARRANSVAGFIAVYAPQQIVLRKSAAVWKLALPLVNRAGKNRGSSFSDWLNCKAAELRDKICPGSVGADVDARFRSSRAVRYGVKNRRWMTDLKP
jgi:hypothetical protein